MNNKTEISKSFSLKKYKEQQQKEKGIPGKKKKKIKANKNYTPKGFF